MLWALHCRTILQSEPRSAGMPKSTELQNTHTKAQLESWKEWTHQSKTRLLYTVAKNPQKSQKSTKLSGNTVFKHPSVFFSKTRQKWTIFGIFNELLFIQNVNVARFARYAEWDFFGIFKQCELKQREKRLPKALCQWSVAYCCFWRSSTNLLLGGFAIRICFSEKKHSELG